MSDAYRLGGFKMEFWLTGKLGRAWVHVGWGVVMCGGVEKCMCI